MMGVPSPRRASQGRGALKTHATTPPALAPEGGRRRRCAVAAEPARKILDDVRHCRPQSGTVSYTVLIKSSDMIVD